MSTQSLLQSESELSLHVVTHDPLEQLLFPFLEEQTRSHVPQWFASVCVLTHSPLQFVKPLAHLKSHFPPVQTGVAFAGAVQAVPQAPQFAGSVLVSAQEPLQLTVPVAQESVQTPSVQTSVDLQAVLQSPQ
jgi:hypothetical protein